MLKNLILKNFRTHEKLDLEFHPGVNVIWGLPGSGKTNILRAMDWVLTNKPKFERVHSHFSKDGETSVMMEFDNGVVELTKTSKINKFLLNKSNSYSYTGATVPEPIGKLLNMTEINISKQLDQHFLITSTPGDIGKTINRITKIEKIDSWISKLITISNKTKWKVEELESDCAELEKEIQQYDGVEELEQELLQYEALCESINSVGNDLLRLENIEGKMVILNSRITKLQTLETDLEVDIAHLRTILDRQEALQDKLTSLSIIKEHMALASARKKQIEAVVLEETNLQDMNELLAEIKDKNHLYVTLQFYVKLSQSINSKQEKLKVKKHEYLIAIEKLGICPVCQNKISLEHIHNLGATL